MSKKKIIEGLTVAVYGDNFEKALRIFTKKVQNSGKLKEVSERQHFEKPSVKKKRSKESAKMREQKRISEEM